MVGGCPGLENQWTRRSKGRCHLRGSSRVGTRKLGHVEREGLSGERGGSSHKERGRLREDRTSMPTGLRRERKGASFLKLRHKLTYLWDIVTFRSIYKCVMVGPG